MLKFFDIEFVKLKNGVHEFDYKLQDTFFSEKEGSLYESGQIDVHLTFRKSDNLFVLDFSLQGFVGTECDRCTDPIRVALYTSSRLNVRIDPEKAGMDEEPDLWYIDPFAHKLNVYDYLYDTICVSLPLRKVCSESMDEKLCNHDFEEKISKEDHGENASEDPRWSKLKDLLNN
jgi:uncharacterized metal-binding protein YceD (DUF177 family)